MVAVQPVQPLPRYLYLYSTSMCLLATAFGVQIGRKFILESMPQATSINGETRFKSRNSHFQSPHRIFRRFFIFEPVDTLLQSSARAMLQDYMGTGLDDRNTITLRIGPNVSVGFPYRLWQCARLDQRPFSSSCSKPCPHVAAQLQAPIRTPLSSRRTPSPFGASIP